MERVPPAAILHEPLDRRLDQSRAAVITVQVDVPRQLLHGTKPAAILLGQHNLHVLPFVQHHLRVVVAQDDRERLSVIAVRRISHQPGTSIGTPPQKFHVHASPGPASPGPASRVPLRRVPLRRVPLHCPATGARRLARRAVLRVTQCEFREGAKVAVEVADVEPPLARAQRHPQPPVSATQQQPDRVCKLDLAPFARRSLFQALEDRRGEHVAGRDRQVARGLRRPPASPPHPPVRRSAPPPPAAGRSRNAPPRPAAPARTPPPGPRRWSQTG